MARVSYAGENHSPEITVLAEKIRSERGRMLNLVSRFLEALAIDPDAAHAQAGNSPE